MVMLGQNVFFIKNLHQIGQSSAEFILSKSRRRCLSKIMILVKNRQKWPKFFTNIKILTIFVNLVNVFFLKSNLTSHSWVCLSLAYKYGCVTTDMTTLPHWKRSRIALGLMYSILGSIFSTLYYCGTPCHGLRFFSADYIHTF